MTAILKEQDKHSYQPVTGMWHVPMFGFTESKGHVQLCEQVRTWCSFRNPQAHAKTAYLRVEKASGPQIRRQLVDIARQVAQQR